MLRFRIDSDRQTQGFQHVNMTGAPNSPSHRDNAMRVHSHSTERIPPSKSASSGRTKSANKTVDTPASKSPFFSRIPPEIRNKIYIYAFTSQFIIQWPEEYRTEWPRIEHAEKMFISKQFYNEACPIVIEVGKRENPKDWLVLQLVQGLPLDVVYSGFG